MINKKDNYVEWSLLVLELCDAKQHLEKLIDEEIEQKDFDETEFSIAIAHIYSHLNRAWNMRNQTGELTPKQWETLSQFPPDIEPF